MNKKTIFIGLGVLLLGGVSFLYFRNKKKQEMALKNALSSSPQVAIAPVQTQQTPAISSGDVITSQTIATNVLDQQNLDKAKEIVKQINKTQSMLISSIMKASLIKKLNEELKKIGYKFSEGLLVKL
jgi:LPXTG-motif cell wall-anchored protein